MPATDGGACGLDVKVQTPLGEIDALRPFDSSFDRLSAFSAVSRDSIQFFSPQHRAPRPHVYFRLTHANSNHCERCVKFGTDLPVPL